MNFLRILFIICLFYLTDIACWNNNDQKSNKPQQNDNQLNVGLIVPHTNFGKREYVRAINSAVVNLQKNRGNKLSFLKNYIFQPTNIHFGMMSLTPSPTGIYESFIHSFISSFFFSFNFNVLKFKFSHKTFFLLFIITTPSHHIHSFVHSYIQLNLIQQLFWIYYVVNFYVKMSQQFFI